MSALDGKSRDKIEKALEEMVEAQKGKILRYGRRFIPTLTSEDVLQPNDYPVLENNPHFRFEEGVLAGMQAVLTALRALSKER